MLLLHDEVICRHNEMNWSVNPHWVAGFEVFPSHPTANGNKPFAIDDE